MVILSAEDENRLVPQILTRKLQLEQQAYAEIRTALSHDYVEDPTVFMKHFGCRPEDLTGLQLREYYPSLLDLYKSAPHLRPTLSDKIFSDRFFTGRMFR